MSNETVSKRTLLKSSFWYILSMFLTRGMVFITMPIFTRLMTKAEYGDFSVYCSWQAILLIFCSLELYGTINRARFDYTEKSEFDSYISSSLLLSLIITTLLFSLYLIFPHIFDKLFLLEKKYMYVMFAYLFTMPAFNMFQTKQRIEYKYKTSSVISLSLALVSPFIAIVLVVIMQNEDPLFGRILGQHILYILFGIGFFVYFFLISKKISFSYWKYALRIGLPLVFSFLGSRILLTSDTLVLKHMCSSEEISYISVTHSTSHIVLILVQTLNYAWSPWLYDMLKIKNYKEIEKLYKLYLWAMILCTFGVLCIGPELISILGSSKYHEAIFVLPANILCGVFTVLTAQFVNVETYYKKPRYAAILTGSVSVLNVLLNILGVSLFGYQAVCYTTVICQIILIALHYIVTQSMNVKSIISPKTLILSLFGTVLLIPIALLLYQNNIIRLCVIVLVFVSVVVVLILKRKFIMQIISKLNKHKKGDIANA